MNAEVIRELIARGECREVDFKAPMSFEGDDRVDLVKDIIALANTRDGGTLLIGVSQGEGGVPTIDGLNPDQLDSFDVTRVAQYVRRFADPEVNLTTSRVQLEGAWIVAIKVVEFEHLPIVVKQEAPLRGTKRPVFVVGDILVRTKAAQSKRVDDANLMREILRLAVRKQGDELLTQMRAILDGARPIASGPSDTVHEKALSYWSSLPREGSGGTLEVRFLPVERTPTVPDPFTLRRQVASATTHRVDLRFPEAGTAEDARNHEHGVVGEALLGGACYKTWYFDESAAFFLRRSLPEARASSAQRIVYWKRLAYTTMLSVAFARRLYCDEIDLRGDLDITFVMEEMEGRRLVLDTFAPASTPPSGCSSSQLRVALGPRRVQDLRVAWRETAEEAIRRIAGRFEYEVRRSDLEALFSNFANNRWG